LEAKICAYREGSYSMHKWHKTMFPRKTGGRKFLKFAKNAEIAHTVKVAPLQNAYKYLRNVQDSPTKAIYYLYKSSVAWLQANHSSHS
jgi:hypothetical protein